MLTIATDINVGTKGGEEMVKVKDIKKLFDVELDLYHKGQWVGADTEIDDKHWINECVVTSIEVERYEVKVDTR